MKTLQELYSEIIAGEEMKKAFAEAAKNDKIVEFAKEHGVDTTADEIKAFLEAKSEEEKELSPEELENAAGGNCNNNPIISGIKYLTYIGCKQTIKIEQD